MLALLVTGVKISEQLRKDGGGSWEGQGEVACSSPGFWKVGVIGAQFRVDRSLPDRAESSWVAAECPGGPGLRIGLSNQGEWDSPSRRVLRGAVEACSLIWSHYF